MTKKAKKKSEGVNVRLSTDAHSKIKKYVEEKGLKLGRFVETAAIDKLQKDKQQ